MHKFLHFHSLRARFPADLYLNCSINPNFWTAFYLASSQKTHLEYCSPPTTLFWRLLLPCSTASEDFIDKTVTLFFMSIVFYSKLDWCIGLHFNTSRLLSVKPKLQNENLVERICFGNVYPKENKQDGTNRLLQLLLGMESFLFVTQVTRSHL